MKTQDYFVYILLCENGAYYTGYTTDLERRYKEHQEGLAKCKFTRSFKPLCIAQQWKVIGSKSLALRIEKEIKRLHKSEKEQLIRAPESLSIRFPALLAEAETKKKVARRQKN
jgi:putative endonuclease